MKNTIRLAISTLVLILSQPASAQTVVQAVSATLQPQIGRDDKGYSTCGVHAVILDVQGSLVDVYDFSLNIYADSFHGLIKAGKMQTSTKDMLANKAAPKALTPAPITFWISRESDGKALRPQKVIAAETPGYILAGAEIAQSYDMLLAVITGERMQFAMRYKNQNRDTVVSFGTAMPEVEFKPLMACLEGVTDQLRQQAETAPK